MGRRGKVNGNECMGLSTPRAVCLNCTLPECIYEHGEPRIYAPKTNPECAFIVKKKRTLKKTGGESVTYLTQFPTTKINSSRHAQQAALFTMEEAKRAVEICKASVKLPTQYFILRKVEELERIAEEECREAEKIQNSECKMQN